jgi:uncharacterized protein YigE (DUF2233 family)
VRKLSALLLAASLAFAGFAQADWNVISATREPASAAGIEHRYLVLQDDSERATLDIALFSVKTAKLRVIDNGSGSMTLADAMKSGNCIAGVNGGYFDTEFKPLGLRVIDGVTISPLTHARLLTAVLCASNRGIEIVRTNEFSRGGKLDAALECGPLLVDRGRSVPRLNNARSARRTFAAILRGGKAALGVSSHLTLAQLSAALANRSVANDLPFWRAMNLDGGSSSAFWFRRSDDSVVSIAEDKPVRDFVAVEAK